MRLFMKSDLEHDEYDLLVIAVILLKMCNKVPKILFIVKWRMFHAPIAAFGWLWNKPSFPLRIALFANTVKRL